LRPAFLFFPARRRKNQSGHRNTRLTFLSQRFSPRAEDVSTIDGMVKAYYEVVFRFPADQPRQWGSRRYALYSQRAVLSSSAQDEAGKTTAQSMTHQEFVDSSDLSLRGQSLLRARKFHRITHRAGNVAHLLSTSEHTSSSTGPVEGRSVDSLELFWDGTRWWITKRQHLGRRVRPSHPLPAEFLP